MIAKCTTRQVSSLTESTLLEHVRQYVHMEEVGLVVGKSYTVFGIAFRDGIPWYLVCEEVDDDYPTLHCSVFFEIVDARVCQEWMLSFGPSNVGTTAMLPAEWASDAHFLEKLIDGNGRAIALFRELKKRYGSSETKGRDEGGKGDKDNSQ